MQQRLLLHISFRGTRTLASRLRERRIKNNIVIIILGGWERIEIVSLNFASPKKKKLYRLDF